MPKLEKQTVVPNYYNKRIKMRSNALETIKEEVEREDIEEQLDAVMEQFGTYGDMVELSRKQILEGFVRPRKGIDDAEMPKIPELEPLPERSSIFFTNTFAQSSKIRWTGFR